MPALGDDLPHLTERGPHFDRLDVGARNHHLFGRHLVEIQDPPDHLTVGLVKQATLLARVDQRLDLLIGDDERFHLRQVDAENPADPPGDGAEKDDQRTQKARRRTDLVDHDQRHPLRVVLGEVLGGDLAENQQGDGHHQGCDQA